MARKKAVALLSGGVDSCTAAAIAKSEGFELHALTLRYGQRHEREIEAAKKVSAALEIRNHLIIDIDLRAIGGSALTDQIDVPKARSIQEISRAIPVTYVPARNTIFLSFALALSERIEAEDIFFGANQLDYSGYPDCREEYIRAFERMAYLATECAVRHLRGEPVPAQIVLPVEIVDRSNLHRWDLPFGLRPIPTLEETLA